MKYRFRAAKSFWRSWSTLSEVQQRAAGVSDFQNQPIRSAFADAQDPPAFRSIWPHPLRRGYRGVICGRHFTLRAKQSGPCPLARTTFTRDDKQRILFWHENLIGRIREISKPRQTELSRKRAFRFVPHLKKYSRGAMRISDESGSEKGWNRSFGPSRFAPLVHYVRPSSTHVMCGSQFPIFALFIVCNHGGWQFFAWRREIIFREDQDQERSFFPGPLPQTAYSGRFWT